MKDILNAESIRGTIVNSMRLSLLFIKWIKENKTRTDVILRDTNITNNKKIEKNRLGFTRDRRYLRSLLLVVTLFFVTIESLQPVLQQENIEQQSFAQMNGNIINISRIVPYAGDPHIAVSQNYIYVVWTEVTTTGPAATIGRNSDIFFSKSADHGASFSIPVGLSTYKTGLKQEPKIAVSGKNLYIIWSDYSSGAAEILFTRSTDNGSSFSSPITLGTSFGAAGETRIAANGNNVYVMWIGSSNRISAGSVLFRSSADNGTTFGNPISLSTNGIASKPEMAVTGNDVYAVWYSSTLQANGVVSDDQILFTRSTDNGANFSNPINLSNNPNTFSARPQVSASGRSVYVTWFESGPNHSLNVANTYFSKSTDGGMTFTTPLQLSNNGPANNYYYFTSDTPQIAISNNAKNVYIAWTYPSQSASSSSSQNSDVFFARSNDSGGTFGPPFNLSNNPGLSGDASMIVSTNANSTNTSNNTNTSHTDIISIIWLDDTGNKPGQYNVFFSESGDSGSSFGNPISISGIQGAAVSPQLAVSGNSIYVTWTEFNSGYYAILFRAVPLQ